MKKLIIAIIDTVANDIVGNPMLFSHPAPALRLFDDVARAGNNAVSQHVADHQLVKLGEIQIGPDTDWEMQPSLEILLTGSQWLAVQPPATNGDK